MASTIELNKAIATKFVKAIGQGDVQTLGALMSKDIVVITTGTSIISGTRYYDDVISVARALLQLTKAGIDLQILNLTAEEDRVACEMEGRATLLSGDEYNNQYHFLLFIADGKIFRMKEYLDTKLADARLGNLSSSKNAQNS